MTFLYDMMSYKYISPKMISLYVATNRRSKTIFNIANVKY